MQNNMQKLKSTLFFTLFLTLIANVYTAQERDATGLQGESMRVKRSDDLSLSQLQALVQQQAQVIQTFESRLTAAINTFETLDNRINAVESKLPSSFAPVAFTAHFSTDDPSNGIHLNQGQTLQFDAAVTNVGNAYNTQTGIFTAPVSGVYTFFLTQMSTNAQGRVELEIVKNGATLDRVWLHSWNPGTAVGPIEDQGSSQVTTHLAAGDQVWVRQDQGVGVRGSWYTVFTGYLVQAD